MSDPNNVPSGVPAPEDHPILDDIAMMMSHMAAPYHPRRESECVEFRDWRSGRWFEIVVREIDEPSRETSDRSETSPK